MCLVKLLRAFGYAMQHSRLSRCLRWMECSEQFTIFAKPKNDKYKQRFLLSYTYINIQLKDSMIRGEQDLVRETGTDFHSEGKIQLVHGRVNQRIESLKQNFELD